MENSVANSNKVKRYQRLAVVCAFLLALLWPLGGYFFWILGGLLAHLLFLIWFYSPREQNTSQQWSRSGGAGQRATAPIDTGKKVKLIFTVVMGLIGFFFVFLMVIGFVFGDPEAEETPVSYTENFDPNNIDDLTNKGNTFYNDKQYDSAMKYYERVLELDRDNQYAMYNKALVYFSREEYRTSIKLLRKCLSQYPDYGYAYYLLGDDYKAISRMDTALICFQKAYDYDLRDTELLQNLGEVNEQLGNTANAVRYYKETLEKDSSVVAVYERLANLERDKATWYLQQAERYRD